MMSLPRGCSGTPNWWRVHETTQDQFLCLFQAIEGYKFVMKDIIHRDMLIIAGSFIVKERGVVIHVQLAYLVDTSRPRRGGVNYF